MRLRPGDRVVSTGGGHGLPGRGRVIPEGTVWTVKRLTPVTLWLGKQRRGRMAVIATQINGEDVEMMVNEFIVSQYQHPYLQPYSDRTN